MGFCTPFVRSRAVSPPRKITVKRDCTKEKDTYWLWERPSRTSSISSVSTPPDLDEPAHRRRRSRSHQDSARSDYYEITRSGNREVVRSEHRQHSDDRHRRRKHSHHHRRRRSEELEREHSHHQDEHKRITHNHSHHHHHHYHQHNSFTPTPNAKPRPFTLKPDTKPDVFTPKKRHSTPLIPSVTVSTRETPIKKPKSRMEETAAASCGAWRETACVATESVVATSSASSKSKKSDKSKSKESDCDNTYGYVAMREPGPQDAVPVAYAYYPQPPYTFVYPAQMAPAPAAAVAPVFAPVKCDEETYNYVAEKVVEKEKSVYALSQANAAAEPRMSGALPVPATAAYPTYPAYPAYPVAYAMSDHPVPVNPVKGKEEGKRTWVGRTKKQVDEDNAKIAHKEGVYKPNDIMPKGAAPDQLFWVVEIDGTFTLRTYRTIEEDLQPGKWKVDQRYGNAYFTRAKN